MRKSVIALIFTFCLIFAPWASAEEISSKAALVMEADTGRVLFAKNPNLKLPPASTTKLMTAMVVLDRARLSDTATIRGEALEIPSTRTSFKAGETVTVGNLLYAALIKSANDATVALAEAVAGGEAEFVRLMNKKAEELGLTDTHFINSNGLPGAGQYTTVHDLANMLQHALMYPAIKGIMRTQTAEISTADGRTILLENTNRLLWSEHEFVGGKTGYTRKAGHCIVCVGQKDGRALIISLLGSPNRETLWRESEVLIGRGFRVIANSEEPVVYLASVSRTALIKKALYKKSTPKAYSKINKKRLAKFHAKKKIKTKKNSKNLIKKTRMQNRHRLKGA